MRKIAEDANVYLGSLQDWDRWGDKLNWTKRSFTTKTASTGIQDERFNASQRCAHLFKKAKFLLFRSSDVQRQGLRNDPGVAETITEVFLSAWVTL